MTSRLETGKWQTFFYSVPVINDEFKQIKSEFYDTAPIYKLLWSRLGFGFRTRSGPGMIISHASRICVPFHKYGTVFVSFLGDK